MEIPKLVSVDFAGGYSLRLTFSDGLKAEVDFEGELRGGIFEALRDPACFQSFCFREQFGSIEWPNGADFCPEFLYEIANASRHGSTKSAAG